MDLSLCLISQAALCCVVRFCRKLADVASVLRPVSQLSFQNAFNCVSALLLPVACRIIACLNRLSAAFICGGAGHTSDYDFPDWF